uniref:Reverse transcriptase domain-containing protein n=1 Tax=Tanacetum cinerariifolium TaxID=118510 RepID=A0A699GL97_TANCI|nr:reverse transcriptase domain-containing protein [Tanacetum cinerariifolium]
MSTRPKTPDFAIESANNQDQQQLLKKQNVVQAYVVGSGEKKPYGGSKPLFPKCNYHHNGECAPKCTNFKKVGHLTKDCWHPTNANNQRTITCYECGNQRRIMPVTRQGANDAMTPKSIQAMIDRAIQRNSTYTQDDASQNSSGGPRRPVQPARHDAAYAMTWETFKKKLTDKYCPKGEFKKLKIEQWNLKVKGNDVGGYSQCFQELALMCTKFLSDEIEKVDKYISGLPDNIHGNVMSTRPKTLDFAIELANDLMDQKLRTYAERQAENKRKLDNNNQDQQQLLKKQNDCWHPTNANNQRTITCYECGNQGYYKSDCPVLKNQGTEARGMVYAFGGGETNQDLDNTEDDMNA